jgi:hypothetical protein
LNWGDAGQTCSNYNLHSLDPTICPAITGIIAFTIIAFTIIAFTIIAFTIIAFTIIAFTIIAFTIIALTIIAFTTSTIPIDYP